MKATKPATPLPWTQEKLDEFNGYTAIMGAHGMGICRVLRNGDPLAADTNAAYIVHACNAYPELVRELRLCNLNEQGEQKQNTVVGRLLAKLGEGA